MNILQFIIIITSVVFLFFGFDIYKRGKANIVHFFVFIFWSLWIAILSFFPSISTKIWEFFGFTRWTDLFLFIWIILLAYFYIDILNKNIKEKQNLTKLISSISIQNFEKSQINYFENIKNENIKDDFLFHIRAHNEWSVIWKTIDDIVKYWFKKILIIDDWSTDNISDIIDQKQKQHKNVKIWMISHNINRWPWAPNQTWFKFVKKFYKNMCIKRVVMFDADGQMDINDMKTFIEKINENPKIDIIFGSRFLGKDPENMPIVRKVLLKIHNKINKLLYWIYVSDWHCGFRVLGISAIEKIQITSDGRHYANEIVEQVFIKKLNFVEIPVNIKYTEYSIGKKWWQKSINSIKIWLEMIYKKFFFR